MKQNNYKVYVHTNKINNKKYFGITCQSLEDRWRKDGVGYKKRCRTNSTDIEYKNNFTIFWKAIQKYGWNNFEHEVLFDNLTEEAAKNKETELIKKYKTHDENFGYNMTLGGEHNTPTEITKEKISKKKKELYSNGELVIWNKGIKCPQLTGEKNGFYGKKHTDETRSKMREHSGMKGKTGSKHPTSRKYIRIKDSKIYNSKTECILDNNMCNSTLFRHCTNQVKNPKFMYYEDYLKLQQESSN